ncbi:AraC family transcriptional regulator [Paenibacillus sp. NPDC056579]|uniref:helix-turn-helix transcriptional regulator n=1 Tax=unclassified Paenibacillus TaxID=185978 RepID=UPI001EF9007A|nr:AraC family transcriptional regulator [Paenibacillus sp. H1-7]ULL14423.1 AraC family transcriptional regulator [Paenibacillus sp. H1-7]
MSRSEIPYDRTPPFSISYTHERETGKRPVIHHYHNGFEFDFFVKADLDIFVKDTKYTIRDGDFFFINEYEIHRIFYHPNRAYARYVINFSKDFIRSMLRESGLEEVLEWMVTQGPRKVETKPEQRSKVIALFDSLVKSYERNRQTGDPLAQAKVKLHLLLLLIQFKELAQVQPPPAAYNPHIKELIRYIDDHYMNPITLEQLQQEFQLSKYYISHLFKETTHFTVFEYILNRRIVEAKKLLEHTELPIIQVAMSCGFNNLQHFYRIFQRHVQLTPLQYRKSLR